MKKVSASLTTSWLVLLAASVALLMLVIYSLTTIAPSLLNPDSSIDDSSASLEEPAVEGGVLQPAAVEDTQVGNQALNTDASVSDTGETDTEQTDTEQTDTEQTDTEQADTEQSGTEQSDTEQADSQPNPSEAPDNQQSNSASTEQLTGLGDDTEDRDTATENILAEPELDLDPVQLDVTLDRGIFGLSGRLASDNFSDVFIRAMRAIAIEPMENQLVLSEQIDSGDEWLFALAESLGSLNQQYSEVRLSVEDDRLRISGTLSSEAEKQVFLASLSELENLSLDTSPDLVQVNVPVDATLIIDVAENRLALSGRLSELQLGVLRDTLQQSALIDDVNLASLEFGSRTFDSPLIPVLPELIKQLQEQFADVTLAATGSSLSLTGLGLPGADEAARDAAVAAFESLLPEGTTLDAALVSISTGIQEQAIPTQSNENDPATESTTDASTGISTETSVNSVPSTVATEAEVSVNQGSQQVESGTTTVVDENITAAESEVQEEGSSTPAPVEPDPTLQPEIDPIASLPAALQPEARALLLEFSRFEYADNSITLSNVQRFKLDKLFEFLFLYDGVTVSIGIDAAVNQTAVQNLNLSLNRADHIKEYLTGLGLESYRVLTYGFGDTRLNDGDNSSTGLTLTFRSN